MLGRLESEKQLGKDDVVYFVGQARKIRDDLDDTVDKLEKFKDELNRELEAIFTKTGVIHEEIER